MNQRSWSVKRSIEALPVLASLVFQAIALDRWVMTLAVAFVLAVVVIFDLYASSSTRRWCIAGGIGLLVGLVTPVAHVPPTALLPPVVLSALTGVLIGVAVLAVLAGSVAAAWISAWLIVALSGQVEVSTILGLMLVVFIGVSLLGAAFRAGVFQDGARVILPLGLFFVMVTLATSGIAAGLRQLDGAFLKTLETFLAPDAKSAKAGIGGEISINARSSITLSQLPVLELSEETGLLRAYVMDQFDGQHWSASSQLRSASHAFAEVPIRSASSRRIEMIPLHDLGNSLPSPAGTWEVRGTIPRVVGGWVLRGETKVAELTLIGDARERLPHEVPGPEYLALPDDLRQELAPFAERLTRQAPASRAKAERIERFFQNNFEYSLETNVSGQDHPLVTFVKERRPAYCVYFASAMAVLLRTQEIPARIVSGFAPVEINPLTNRVTIRQRDAHAWVEAWLEEEGRFVAFDPTPSGSRERVVGHSGRPGVVSAILGAAGSVVRRTWLELKRDPVGMLARLLKSPISWLLLAGPLVSLLIRRRKKHASDLGGPGRIEASDPLLRKIYGRYVHSLRLAGVAPYPWETEDELIARLSDTIDPTIAAAATKFMAHYRRARFCGEAVDEQLLELAKLGIPDGRRRTSQHSARLPG
jgi:transglutaminase-like putative cysteine protease